MKGMVTSAALSCQLEKWEEKTAEFSKGDYLDLAKAWPRGEFVEVETDVSGAGRLPRSAWPCLLLPDLTHTDLLETHLAPRQPMDPGHMP